MWVPVVRSSAAFHFLNKLLRRNLLPTRCDLDLDFQRQRRDKNLHCVKKQLLVKCMANELISLFQVFGLICYGITASFMKNNWGECSSKSNLDKGSGIAIVSLASLQMAERAEANRDNKNIKTLCLRRVSYEGSGTGVPSSLHCGLVKYWRTTRTITLLSVGWKLFQNQSLSVCWCW